MSKPLSSKICQSVSEASALLHALGNPNRLAIICFLMEGERSVGELEEILGIRQPTLSQQLTALRDAGIISGRRVGKAVFYCVSDPRSETLIDTLRVMFNGLDHVAQPAALSAISTDLMFD